jgi:hypothetical protein
MTIVMQLATTAAAFSEMTTRISLHSDGTQADGGSSGHAISSNGRYVSFTSYATNLVDNDTNGYHDVFIHDRQTGTTKRVSVDSSGVQSNGTSTSSSHTLSADGRYVAFSSGASNLVAGDANGVNDAFVHDCVTGTTTRISVDSAGAEANGASSAFSISADGRYVAFASAASNLVAADGNTVQDVFVHDRLTGVTTRVSLDSSGTEANEASYAPYISADGCHVAFGSPANNLVPNDTNSSNDAFVRDLQIGITQRVSVDSFGTEANDNTYSPVVASGGRFVAFHSYATNLVPSDTNGSADVFVYDRWTATTTRVSVDSSGMAGNGTSFWQFITPNGRYVGFGSNSTNLVTGDTNGYYDTFVHDRVTGTTTRISLATDGSQGNGNSNAPAMSVDGRTVAFNSEAANLVTGDTNGYYDIFVNQQPVLLPHVPILLLD